MDEKEEIETHDIKLQRTVTEVKNIKGTETLTLYYLEVIVRLPVYLGRGVEPHQGVEGELPVLVLLPLLEHLTLPHPDEEHSPHPCHHALAELVTLAPVIINTLVRLNKDKGFIFLCSVSDRLLIPMLRP